MILKSSEYYEYLSTLLIVTNKIAALTQIVTYFWSNENATIWVRERFWEKPEFFQLRHLILITVQRPNSHIFVRPKKW